MNVTIPIPDDLAAKLGAGTDLDRLALESLIVEGFRGGRVTKGELADALGFEALNDVDGFLTAHGGSARRSAGWMRQP